MPGTPPWSLSDLGWCPAGHGDELTCPVILAHSELHGSLGVLSCEHCLWVTKSAIKSFHFQKWKIRVIVNILVFFLSSEVKSCRPSPRLAFSRVVLVKPWLSEGQFSERAPGLPHQLLWAWGQESAF